MAIGDLFTSEFPDSNKRKVCDHSLDVIRYKIVKINDTFVRVYQKQCIGCRMATSQRIAWYEVPNVKTVNIWDNGLNYRERDNTVHLWALKNIPFKSNDDGYKKYLSKNKWRKKRNEVLQRDGGVCQICCTNNANHVHHLTYNNLYDEPLEDLISVCASCHMRLHKSGDNARVPSIPK